MGSVYRVFPYSSLLLGVVMPDTLLRFQYTQFAPPGGRWFYTVPETGRHLESLSSLRELESIVRQHYKINSMVPPEDLGAQIENFICLSVAPGFCEGKDPRVPGQAPLTVFEISAETEKLFRGKTWALVAPPTADRRVEICRACPEHSLGICTSCNQLQQMARRLVHGRALSKDRMLGVCKIYRTPINGLVQVSEPPVPLATRPSNCWAVVEAAARKAASNG